MASSGVELGSSSFFSSRTGISRRPGHGAPPPAPAPPPHRRRPLALHPDIDPPPPPPRPVIQLFAFGIILFFAALQFFPATHFRDPNDPLRRWIPFDLKPVSSSTVSSSSDADPERINIVSWVECLDLRVLSVLINSTLSNSRVREKVHFHLLISENEEEKAAYHKLKVLFPLENLYIIGQKEIIDRIKASFTGGKWSFASVRHVVPLMIPYIYPSLSRFIYVLPNTIVKGSVEDLFGIQLGIHAIAAVEDCGRNLGSYTDISVLNAIQRTAAKAWVPEKLYDADACTPDLNVLLIDAQKLGKDIVEAFFWWNKVLDHKTSSGNGINPSIMVTLSEKYFKLNTTWKFVPKAPQADDDALKFFGFDGEIRNCLDVEPELQELNFSGKWRHYLSPNSEIILGHPN